MHFLKSIFHEASSMKEKLSYPAMSLYFDRELREITLLTFDIVSGTILPVVRNEREGRA